jgi:protein-S-isoprenylcysteine O-methyltransferase Ste14
MPTIDPLEIVGAAWLVLAAYWFTGGLKVKRAARSEPAGDRLVHIVMMGAAFYLIAVYNPNLGELNRRFIPERRWATALGVALTFAGVAFAIWARHHIGRYWSARVSIVSEHKLIRTGPYARIRHPIYTGLLLAVAGTALVVGEYRALVGLGIALFGFVRKARKEESFLAAQFDEGFEEQRRLTGFFCQKCFEDKGLMAIQVRFPFPIGFGDAADVIPVDGRLIRVRIVRRAEPAHRSAQVVEGSIR